MTEEQIRGLTTVRGTRYDPVLLGKFTDTGADPFAPDDLRAQFFDGPWPNGTLHDYWDEISYGNIDLKGTVYDWVTTSRDDDYYAGGCHGLNNAFAHTDEFVHEILQLNDALVDFSEFDNDGPDGIPNSGDDDGYVDFIAVVHPESGGECWGAQTHDIWAHSWRLSRWPSGEFTTNDARVGGGFIRINDYTIMPGISCMSGMIEIGIFGGNRGDAGDPFCNGDVFSGTGTPTSRSHSGAATSVEVSNITGCGTSTLRANLIVGYQPVPSDLCMRDCGADACSEPSPCDVFWESPEIYIDNNGDGIIDPPAAGIENRLFARVRNIGYGSASGNNVAFYYSDPAMGQLFPSTGALIGTDDVPIIPAGESGVAEVRWTIPTPPAGVDHYCIGVIAENADDVQNDEYAPNDDNLAQINVQALYAKVGDAVPPALPRSGDGTEVPGPFGDLGGRFTLAGDPPREIFERTMRVNLCNPLSYPCQFFVQIGSPPYYGDAVIPPDWTVELQFTQVYLTPRQCVPLLVRVKDNHPVHGDFAKVPLTLLCNNQLPVGGVVLYFEIDNVPPQSPCGFTVRNEVLPEGDQDPGDGAVEIAWNDHFTDILGFPDRTQRWQIFRETHPDFVPGPMNLIRETCIDERRQTDQQRTSRVLVLR